MRIRLLFAMLTVCATTAEAQVVRQYEAKFTNTAPTIDGVISPNEWSKANSATGDFKLLRSPDPGTPDNQNNRWQALWNNNGLYILAQSDYGNWTVSAGAEDIEAGIDFGADNLNLYFDPNRDGGENFPTDPLTAPFDQVSGYQIAFNQWQGQSSYANNVNTGFGGIFLEAHVNTLFGNQARGELKNEENVYNSFGTDLEGKKTLGTMAIGQNNTTAGGLTELFIPWSYFNGWLPEDTSDPEATPANDATGLYSPTAPSIGDTWFFNIARITSDPENFLPTWNYTTSQFFASHPHGELKFVRNFIAGDVNGDDTVNIVDFAILRRNFGTPGDRAKGDLDGNGQVNLFDFAILRTNFGNSGSVVPEPALGSLAVLAMAGAALRRRHTRVRK